MRRGVVIVAASLLLLAAAGCGSSSSSSSEGTTTEASGGGGGGQKTIAGVMANDHGTKAVEDSGKTEVERRINETFNNILPASFYFRLLQQIRNTE